MLYKNILDQYKFMWLCGISGVLAGFANMGLGYTQYTLSGEILSFPTIAGCMGILAGLAWMTVASKKSLEKMWEALSNVH